MKRPQPVAALDMRPHGISVGAINNQKLKRPLDLLISFLAFILAFPLMGVIATAIRLSSKGPFLYMQERIGKDGKPFTMYKFRSMERDAEKDGPALATENDQRITRLGRVLRKWRLDELPQLWNVIKGDMSLVGPRPERKCYIDQIIEKAPNYKRLQKIKPGLTSMGIIEQGYASTIAEMVERQRHDQYYFENRSLGLDLAILARSVGVVLGRKGK